MHSLLKKLSIILTPIEQHTLGEKNMKMNTNWDSNYK